MPANSDLASALFGTGQHDDSNITDALFAIAYALDRVATAINETGYSPLDGQTFDGLESAIGEIAEAISNRKT